MRDDVREITWQDHMNEKYDSVNGRNVWVEWQGNRLEVKVIKETLARVPEKEKGPCKGFSDSARFRCLRFVAGIDWQAAGESYFCTLTYPDHVDWGTYAIRQKHLSNLQTLLRRHYERPVGFLWRIEWKVRQSGVCSGLLAPHVHALIFNAPMLTKMNVWKWWMSAIGERDYANVDCEELYNRTRVGLYIAKYSAKQDGLLGYDAYLGKAFAGRAWGHRYKASIPRFPVKKWQTTLNAKTVAVMHEVRGDATCWALGYNDSFTVLGDKAQACGAFMARLTVDGEIPNV